MFSFLAAFLVLNVLLGVAASTARVRDPEYGIRNSHLKARLAENPGRPLVLVLGSSRAAMGVRPSEWEAIRPRNSQQPDPLLFNMSIIGSGPVMELMMLRRVYGEGFRPAVVLLEFWSPFLHQDGQWTEVHRIARDRLMDRDRQIVREYFQDPKQLEEEMDWRSRHPVFGHRERLLGSVLSRWVPPAKRTDWTWEGMDDWGWKPGIDLEPGMTAFRAEAHIRCAEHYKPLLDEHRVSPIADRAYRAAIALAREHGAAVGLVFMPESSEFRKLYPPAVEQASNEYLAKLSSELNVPVINGREWLDDGFVVDGFHLSRIGAAEFTRKLGPAVSATFPQVQP